MQFKDFIHPQLHLDIVGGKLTLTEPQNTGKLDVLQEIGLFNLPPNVWAFSMAK